MPAAPAPSDDQPAWTTADLAIDPHLAPDKAARVRRMFAAIARSYDANNRLHSLGMDQRWRRRAVRECRVRPTDDVLDAACGTGDLALAFADAGARRVVGVDFAEPMLAVARRKTARRQRSRTCSTLAYHHGDVTRLRFPDASFDIVSIAYGLRNVDDPMRALLEFRRVLRPGGRLVILEFSQPANRFLRLLNSIYCERLMPWTASLIARDRSGAYHYLPRSVRTFPHPRQLAAMLADADFVQVMQRPLTFGICTITIGQAGSD